jgi:hypothetical protein
MGLGILFNGATEKGLGRAIVPLLPVDGADSQVGHRGIPAVGILGQVTAESPQRILGAALLKKGVGLLKGGIFGIRGWDGRCDRGLGMGDASAYHPKQKQRPPEAGTHGLNLKISGQRLFSCGWSVHRRRAPKRPNWL